MTLSERDKSRIRRELASCFSKQPEVRKVVIFGSFLRSSQPRDLDIAVFQDSPEDYLPLAMRYRRLTRSVAHQIPLDILPLRDSQPDSSFMSEVHRGQVIYER
jgi:predicted nucleotidyltransferase